MTVASRPSLSGKASSIQSLFDPFVGFNPFAERIGFIGPGSPSQASKGNNRMNRLRKKHI